MTLSLSIKKKHLKNSTKNLQKFFQKVLYFYK